MTSFLSTLSGQFAKNIILGTLFPVLLFWIAITGIVLPIAHLTPGALLLLLFSHESDSDIIPLSVFVLLVSVVLYALNLVLVKFYEGYPWQNSWIGQWRTSHHVNRALTLRQVREQARTLLRQAKETGVLDALPPNLPDLLTRAGFALDVFPLKTSSILPTRLGNVIRAFEGYPMAKYGIDAIVLWPRLAQKLSKEVVEGIDNAKAKVDFMLNCSVLSAITSGTLVAAIIACRHRSDCTDTTTPLTWTASFLILAYLFYLGAITCAESWGSEIKAAFDLSRLDLLTGLGYKLDISSPKEERELWQLISYELLHPDAPNLVAIPFKRGQTVLKVVPADIVISIDRQVTVLQKRAFEIEIAIKNTDLMRRTADSIDIIETIPKNFRVVENTVEVDGLAVRPRSAEPLIVSLGSLDPGQTPKKLKYKVQKA